MSGLHAAGYFLVLGVVAAYGSVGAFVALAGRVPRWTDDAWLIALIVLASQAALGVALAVLARGPSASLHWIYGFAGLVLLLTSNAFAVGSPPRQRGAIMFGTAVGLALLAWRLSETG